MELIEPVQQAAIVGVMLPPAVRPILEPKSHLLADPDHVLDAQRAWFQHRVERRLTVQVAAVGDGDVCRPRFVAQPAHITLTLFLVLFDRIKDHLIRFKSCAVLSAQTACAELVEHRVIKVVERRE